jgi:hypothetical protein
MTNGIPDGALSFSLSRRCHEPVTLRSPHCQGGLLPSHQLSMEGVVMDIEVRLSRLESRYRAALGAAVAAKANYWALAGEPSATTDAVERARSRWEQLESRKRSITARMGELEALEEG